MGDLSAGRRLGAGPWRVRPRRLGPGGVIAAGMATIALGGCASVPEPAHTSAPVPGPAATSPSTATPAPTTPPSPAPLPAGVRSLAALFGGGGRVGETAIPVSKKYVRVVVRCTGGGTITVDIHPLGQVGPSCGEAPGPISQSFERGSATSIGVTVTAASPQMWAVSVGESDTDQ